MATFGTIENLQNELKHIEALNIVFSYLKDAATSGTDIHTRICNLECDKYEKFDLTSDIFVIEQSYKTRLREDTLFESHIQYVDFQCMIQGEEIIEVTHPKVLTPTMDYNKDDDYRLYDKINSTSKILLEAGNLIIIHINDAHMPTLQTQKNISEQVFKSVVKVPTSLFH